MNRILIQTAGLLFSLLGLAARLPAAERPNIIFILSDDQGYGDFSCHGNPVLKTPNLDRIHDAAVRFTDFHVSPTCAPTRSALLSGKHEFKNGVTHTIFERERMSLKTTTIVQVLHDAGYATGIFGKWHLGDEAEYQPDHRGFDEVFIHGGGGIGQTYPGSCGDAPGNQYLDPAIRHNGWFEQTKGYCTDVFFAQAMKWIESVKGRKRFFCYLPTNVPHGPLQVPPGYEELYAGKVATNAAKFFGMLANLDDNVGRLLAQLQEWGLERDTLVIFMNDNGGTAGCQVWNAGMRGQKGTPWQGGTRAASFWRWPGTLQPGDVDKFAAHVDLFPTLAELAGAAVPADVAAGLDGRSLVPLLRNPRADWPERNLVTHVGRWAKGQAAESKYLPCRIRNSRYSLVSDARNGAKQWELFDLKSDYGEKNNIALDYPELVREFAAAYDQWWTSVQPLLVNETAPGPKVNPFKALYWQQFGGGPSAADLRAMDPNPPDLGQVPQAPPKGKPSATERPNILWLVSEDNDTLLGCYGDPLARTPTLDKLARAGVLYERCFAQPVCAPSRFTLITGMYAVGHGPAQHMRAQGKIPSWLKGFPALLRAAGYYTSNNAKTDYNSPISVTEAWDESSRNAHWRKRPDPAPPFFSVFNHEVTHESCLFPTQDRPLTFTPTDPAKVRLPPYQPDTPEMRADWARYYDCLTLMDGQIAAKLKDLADAGLAENTIVFYYSDNGGVLPRSKRFLQESGTHVPLIVYFPPKWRHLAPAPPGSRLQEPVSFVDFAPTVLSLAGVKIPAYMQGRAFLGPAKAAPNKFVFLTRDRMDERYDMMRSVATGRWLYIHNYRPDLAYVQPLDYMFQARGYQSWARMAREGKLTTATAQFWGEKPTEELYDMLADPDSVKNLAGNAAHRATLERMRAALRQRVLEVKDNGFLPEGSALEGYDASHQPGAYPVEKVFILANLASERSPVNLPKLIEALADPCEPIRWWAAQGCTMLREKAASAERALRQRLDDPSGAVQVAAAEALARLGKTDTALPVLERWLKNADSPWSGLQAANVLDRLGERARPALPVMRATFQRVADETGATNPLQYQQRILERILAVLDGQTPALIYPTVNQPNSPAVNEKAAANLK